MSDQIFKIGIIAIFFCGMSCIPIAWLVFKRSIMYKISVTIIFPITAVCIFAFIMGARGFTHIIWAFPAALVVIFSAFYIIYKALKVPIMDICSKMALLSKGDVNISFDEKYLKKQNEIVTIKRMLLELTESLKDASTFADNVAEGNFDDDYTLRSENDRLGKSLLKMLNLQKDVLENEERQREEERRNWIMQGLAKFAEILRSDHDNIETLSQNVISGMVKYLDVNQGGIFVLNDSENDAEKFLELKACYAFDRKKFAEKKIRIGEGLIGTCYLEGQPIYMTDVPNEYINITSGLGDANPRAIYICPLKVNDNIYGVIELASFSEFEPHHLDFIQKVSESIASTLSSVRVNLQTAKLLEQTKLQAEEMANAEEELRQNMEEMRATQEEMRRRETELLETIAKLTGEAEV